MENTPGNKAKFFAQYWGQKVMKQDFPTLGSFTYQPDGFIRDMSENFYLELKPLSSIIDEDAYDLAVMYFERGNEPDSPREAVTMVGKRVAEKYFKAEEFQTVRCLEIIQVSDYLRSKGYALPWMGKSVEDQVKDGWIKLKEA